jgi:hypothetical protein
VTFFSLPAASEEIVGKTESGRNFIIESSNVEKRSNSDGIFGDAKLIYKISDSNEYRETYVFPAEAPVVVRKNKFGLVTVSEKTGGMNGTYKVTYLYPTDDGLLMIGAAESSMDNGSYTGISRDYPEQMKRINEHEKIHLIKSFSNFSANFFGSSRGESIDDAMLFFVVPELMAEIKRQNSEFPIDYSNYLNSEIDSSLANLIRRSFLTRNGSLCDVDQFDVFVCGVGKKYISICSGKKGGALTLQYRAGLNGKIEILLEKPFSSFNSSKIESESFENGGYRYTVRFGDIHGSGWAGVLVEKMDAAISKMQCRAGTIEPYLLPEK